MPSKNKNTWFVSLVSLLFGCMDSLTGLMLILAPMTTLGLMNIPSTTYPSGLIGFIGAFVLANGSIYLWALAWAKNNSAWSALKIVWMGTAWVRICVGITTSVLIFKGQLMTAWSTVPATDLIVAALQLYWIGSGRFPKDD